MKRHILVAVALVAALATSSALAAAKSQAHHTRAVSPPASLVSQLAVARDATAKYATSLATAKADGYGIITKMIPNMGYHYMNPNVKGFDPAKPAILVYEKSGAASQLAALEWVFTSKPAHPPFAGARYGSFGAGCHYADGSFVPAESQDTCPKTAPGSGAAFGFWHPLLVTLHVWLWYPNPSGLFASTNPLVAPYNKG